MYYSIMLFRPTGVGWISTQRRIRSWRQR